LSLSVNNNYYAGFAARTNLAQGSAAIASWLNSINNGGPPTSVGAPPQNGPSLTVSGGGVGAPTISINLTQLQADDSASLQPANQNASDYQQAVAAYGDN
jgi:hypothetical protein